MRYIFIEKELEQIVFDIETVTQYVMEQYATDHGHKLQMLIVQSDHEITDFDDDQAISFWRQLAKQVDGRCSIKDARKKMETYTEGAEATND